MDKKHCAGCCDNFYNGNNDLGVKVCWMLKSAARIRRVRVHVDQRPPWTAAPELLPNCYTKDRFVFFKAGDPILKAANELKPHKKTKTATVDTASRGGRRRVL